MWDQYGTTLALVYPPGVLNPIKARRWLKALWRNGLRESVAPDPALSVSGERGAGE
jgi:hypothetical protein